MAASFKIEGLSELEDALKELPKATGKNVLKRALIAAAEPIVQDAEARAPVRSGTLERSIGASQKLSRRQAAANTKGSTVEVYVGAGALPQAHMQEFGTAHNAPKPFMRPAWDGNKMAALNSIKDDLAAEIEKARKRLARKAERDAAKLLLNST